MRIKPGRSSKYLLHLNIISIAFCAIQVEKSCLSFIRFCSLRMVSEPAQPIFRGPPAYDNKNNGSEDYPSEPPILRAPYPRYSQAQHPFWSTSLCACSQNCSSCWIAFFFPCVTFGRIAEIIDEGKITCCLHATIYSLFCAVGAHCLYSCMYRKKLRAKFNLPEQPCDDCCVHSCCECCALAQEHRELQHRGFNPAAGWVGPSMAAPHIPPAMYR
eukprot:Gb_37165 [translate_table: standard]